LTLKVWAPVTRSTFAVADPVPSKTNARKTVGAAHLKALRI
jgi:hypothetical protein